MIPILLNAWNSVFTTLMGTVLPLFSTVLAGFAFAKYQFPEGISSVLFCDCHDACSSEVGAVPLFIIMKKLNLVNSLWSLVIPRVG